MTERRKLWAVVLVASLLGVAVTVALSGSEIANALPGAQSSWLAAGPHGPKPDSEAAGLDAAAKALGITTDELAADLQSGKTIAQVAAEKGVDVNAVIDAMVTAAQPQLRQHITDLVNKGAPKPDDRGPADKPHDLDTVAHALGMSTDDLAAQLRTGKSIAQVASDKGVDVNTVINAIVTDKSAAIDAAVTAGKITKAEGDAQKADLEQHVTDMVNKTPPPGPPHGPKGFGPRDHGSGHGPDDDSSSSSSSS
jgi:hypothetical protein